MSGIPYFKKEKPFTGELFEGERIFRVRMYRGDKGGSNYYFHADIITTHYKKALAAARQDRVRNWRWIDTYDTSDRDYKSFEYLYIVEPFQARKAARPLERILEEK